MRYIHLLALLFTTSFACEIVGAACFRSSIVKPAPFLGNNGEVFQLADGSWWEVKFEYEYMYEYYPDVVICPDRGLLIIGDSQLTIQSLTARGNGRGRQAPAVLESQIDGEFEGWEGETIIKLVNGQIWQQIEYYYQYSYSYMPDVLVYRANGGYKMKVEGINKAITVIRLK